MDTMQAIRERHSVRAYKKQTIEEEKRAVLDQLVQKLNDESGLRISIQYDDPEGFDSRLAHYGKFENVSNSIVMAGKKNEDISEKCGYYGEWLVLEAQKLGLNTCWVASTFNRSMVKKSLPEDEKLCVAIALGYGKTNGVQHKSKSLDRVSALKGEMPEWFKAGMEAALLAPTAINQQKFKVDIIDGEPVIRVAGLGGFTKVDLGIVKYHFEVASGKKVR